ncbi:hypothetical protein [Thiocystis violascens]|uniref:Uncharacterized protein n=1 Tax=Thiocystis violascens (strain ATCC 17096 / DSM 198 / 6111) TaxID=765911 RepID=I3Y6B7_THIV6|nr:hypothetical protein [Thiocystis violascens]AFL72535.1 hypothetical protein Thivi_0474 [Thiocystis violascens DSM 198]AFL73874.1 hypothetical protein Thivi_1911 [Thiocystis violascens DSM 198]
MGSVKRLADEVARGLREVHPRLRKTVVNKLALAVGAMIEGQTPNTVELANLLPLDTERQDLREQWLRRLLKNPRLGPGMVIEPFARAELAKAASHGQTVSPGVRIEVASQKGGDFYPDTGGFLDLPTGL